MGSKGSKMGTCTTVEQTFDRWVGTKYDPQIKYKTTFHNSQTTRADCSGTWGK